MGVGGQGSGVRGQETGVRRQARMVDFTHVHRPPPPNPPPSSRGYDRIVAVGKLPAPRLDVLTAMFHPRKTTPADVKFTDVVGMSGKAADRKEPISRQTLGFLSTV